MEDIMKLKYTVLITFSIALTFQMSFAQLPWTKYPGNPVLSADTLGAWDSGPVQVDAVLYDGELYRMWYTAAEDFESAGAVGYATSTDGISWTKYAGNPVFLPGQSGQWDVAWAGSITVLFTDSLFHMWYGGGNGSVDRIGYATSPDGINWTRSPNNPVLSQGEAGSWDEVGVQQPVVLFDGALFHMWYHSPSGAGIFKIGYATSDHGVIWTKHESNPVLEEGDIAEWDNTRVISPFVIKRDTRFHLWYQGSNGQVSQLGYATSDNGSDWIKSDSNPVLSPGTEEDWDNFGVASPTLILNDTTFQMWYSGINNVNEWQVGYATASLIEDSVTWIDQFKNNKYPNTIYLSQNYPNPFNPVTAISYQLTAISDVDLSVYNLLGHKVATLVKQKQPAGSYQVEWDASRFSSGIYYYRLQAGEYQDVKKMVLLK